MEEPNCKICRCVDGPCFNKKTLDLDLLPIDPSDLISSDPLNIEIPVLNPKINVNMDEPLENIDSLKEELVVDVDLEKVMSDIEKTANFNSAEEGLQALNNPDTIFTRLQTAFDTFKELVGRQMTYSEMRNMMG
jgi:hypothetical protein